MLISIPGSRLFTRNKADLGVYSFMLVFGNVGFIGYPVVAALFGHEAIFFAAVLNFANSLFIFSLGMFFVSGGQQKLHFDYKFLINPILKMRFLNFRLRHGLSYTKGIFLLIIILISKTYVSDRIKYFL